MRCDLVSSQPSRAGWFYLGKHKLTYAPIDSVWDKLIQKVSKQLSFCVHDSSALSDVG